MLFDFEGNQLVEDISTVPENLRPFYEQNAEEAGGYILSNTPAVKAAIAVISGQTKALTAARTEAKGLKGKAVDLSALGAYGATPEEIAAGFQSKIEELELAAKTDPNTKIDLDKVRADMKAAHSVDMQKHTQTNKALENQINTYLVTNEFARAVGKSGDAELVESVLGRQVQVVVGEDGTRRSVVVDAAGDIRFNGVGAEMSITELVAEAKVNPKTARLFDSESPNGGNNPPNMGTRRVVTSSSGTHQAQDSVSKIARGIALGQAKRGR